MEYKIAVVGPEFSGKTSLITRLRTNYFNSQHLPTIGVDTSNLKVKTSKGEYILSMWDFSGTMTYEDKKDGYFKGLNAAIINVDISTKNPFQEAIESAYQLYYDIVKTNLTVSEEEFCLVFVFNKSDRLKDLTSVCEEINTYHSSICPNIPYYIVSNKNNQNLSAPFEFILRSLTKNKNFVIDENNPITGDLKSTDLIL